MKWEILRIEIVLNVKLTKISDGQGSVTNSCALRLGDIQLVCQWGPQTSSWRHVGQTSQVCSQVGRCRAVPFSERKTIVASLKCTRSSALNQWKLASVSVMWSERRKSFTRSFCYLLKKTQSLDFQHHCKFSDFLDDRRACLSNGRALELRYCKVVVRLSVCNECIVARS